MEGNLGQGPENSSVLESPKTEKSFLSPTVYAAYSLIEHGAIISKPDERPYYEQFATDLAQAVEVLKAIDYQQGRLTKLEPSQKLELEGKAQNSYKKVVKAFVQRGLVPKHLAAQVGYLLRPDGVEILDADYHRFLYMSDHFPASGEERAALQLGYDRYQQHIEELSSLLSSEGISLSSEAVAEISRRWGIAHEYGHAVERTIEINQMMAQVLANPQEEVWRLAYKTTERINDDVYQNIAPQEQLKETLRDEPNYGFYVQPRDTSSERIASGFEIAGLQYALEESGIGSDQVSRIIDKVLLDYQRRFQECRQFQDLAKTKGMNLEITAGAFTHLSMQLKETGNTDLRERVPTGVGSRFLGYFFPLQENELQKYVNTYSSSRV